MLTECSVLGVVNGDRFTFTQPSCPYSLIDIRHTPVLTAFPASFTAFGFSPDFRKASVLQWFGF